jgi:hypothetical protein
LWTAVLVVSAIVAYMIYILGGSTIYQLVVKMRLRQAAVETVAISGNADYLQACEATSSAAGPRRRARCRRHLSSGT